MFEPDVVQAWAAAIQTALIVLGLGFGVYQIRRAERAGREADAQTAYREYLSLCVEYPLLAEGKIDQTASSEAQARYVRFVTYAFVACEKICDTALRPSPFGVSSRTTDFREWERSVDEVLSIHAAYARDATRLTDQELLAYSSSFQRRLQAMFPERARMVKVV